MKTTKEDRDEWRELSQTKGALFLSANSIIQQLLDDIDTLKAALEQVEWVDVSEGGKWYTDVDNFCPWCRMNQFDEGHTPDCPRQLTLHEGE